MISAVLVDGVQVNNEFTFLSSVKDSAAAQTDLSSYSRGGRSGVSLGNPFYRGFVVALEWTIICRSYSQLVQQRDRLARFFRIKPDKTAKQSKRLGFVMADGSVREIPAVFSPYVGSIRSQDVTKTTIQVTAQTEMEYFVSSAEFKQTVTTLNLGGFAIPFSVPFDMSNNPTGQNIVINNQGNSEFYPTVKIYGPLDELSLINDTTGMQISYAEELSDSDVLSLDLYNQTALLNNNQNALAGISGNWWYLDPGSNSIRLVASTGTGYAEINYRYAYRGI